MTKDFRRSVSRRRQNTSVYHKRSDGLDAKVSRNKIIKNTISETKLKSYGTNQDLEVNEYMDKPQKLRGNNSLSFEKLQNVNISKYLGKRKTSCNKSFDVAQNKATQNVRKIRKNRALTQTKLKSLLHNNPSKKLNLKLSNTIKKLNHDTLTKHLNGFKNSNGEKTPYA
mmetsp:Transcript_32620/g.28875  ORF Transcript_32620/g.28875 Transcript_32620/m.28875 type:complete len:169 (-) Transcript_32620:38-544(-)